MGNLWNLKKSEMLTCTQLAVFQINGILADKSYLTLDNDLISGWQWALLEICLIINSAERRRHVKLAHFLFFFCNIASLSWEKATQILTSAESFDEPAANYYWCLVDRNAYWGWFNLDEKTYRGYGSETELMMIKGWLHLIPETRYEKK